MPDRPAWPDADTYKGAVMLVNTAGAGFLSKTFGARVSFDPVERMLYSHDVGDIPYLIKPLLGKTTPQAVVQPENEG
jgi:hypothetical protein